MKHRTGHLFKRGSNFYVRWTVGGKVFSKALRDETGNAITSKREAEEARAKLMAPFTVATEAEALESSLESWKAEDLNWLNWMINGTLHCRLSRPGRSFWPLRAARV